MASIGDGTVMGNHALAMHGRSSGRAGFGSFQEMGPVPELTRIGEEDAGASGFGGASGGGLDGGLGPDRDRLLLEHLPTVRYLARRIHERLPQHVELDDLVSAGVVGLIDAFSKFDHTKKVQFKSYAQFRIRGAVARFFADTGLESA